MAGKATAKVKVKNGIEKAEPALSKAYIDDLGELILRMDKTEDDIDGWTNKIDGLINRVNKIESRLGIG